MNRFRKILRFIANPHLLICLLIAWMITNGWAYILMWIGKYLNIEWMMAVSGAYIAFVWLPLSPEKTLTFAIAIVLLRLLFPGDQKTLGVLKDMLQKAKNAIRYRKIKRNTEHEPIDITE